MKELDNISFATQVASKKKNHVNLHLFNFNLSVYVLSLMNNLCSFHVLCYALEEVKNSHIMRIASKYLLLRHFIDLLSVPISSHGSDDYVSCPHTNNAETRISRRYGARTLSPIVQNMREIRPSFFAKKPPRKMNLDRSPLTGI
jgi:hypothetical protein